MTVFHLCPGQLDFVFVVESDLDPAHNHLQVSETACVGLGGVGYTRKSGTWGWGGSDLDPANSLSCLQVRQPGLGTGGADPAGPCKGGGSSSGVQQYCN